MSCPSSIRHWDSNPRPLERESPPITTRPGLPPNSEGYFTRPLVTLASSRTTDAGSPLIPPVAAVLYTLNHVCTYQSDQIWRFIGLWGNFLKPLATINLPKSPTFLGNFYKGVKIYHFSSEIIFGTTFIDIWQFFSGYTVTDTT